MHGGEREGEGEFYSHGDKDKRMLSFPTLFPFILLCNYKQWKRMHYIKTLSLIDEHLIMNFISITSQSQKW